MGRKGVSKRKPGKTKTAPFSKDKASSSVTSVLKAAESQPARAIESEKAAPSAKDGAKSSPNSKKKSKKKGK